MIHLHWPEQFYQTGTRYRVGIGLVDLWRFLLQARVLGYRLVWTIHELLPHSAYSSRYPIAAHRYARRLLSKWADAVTVNCEAARLVVESEFQPRGTVKAVHLGSYAGFYPDTMTREEARVRLGLGDEHIVFLVFGTMRKNRDPAVVVTAFRQLEAHHARLFIVGNGGGGVHERAEQLAWGDWRIRIYPHVIENDDVQVYFRASDVVVMPGKDYLSSAVAMLAMSFGRPMIAQDYGCTPEMVGDAGMFYAQAEADGLRRCLEAALSANLVRLSEAASARSTSFSWDRSAKKLVELYEAVGATRDRRRHRTGG